MINKWMCSKQCPCKSKDKELWFKEDPDKLQDNYGRTISTKRNLNGFLPLVFDDKLRSVGANGED
jgi:hypothetical protein